MPTIIKQKSGMIDDKHLILCYKYINGSFPKSSTNDLILIAKSLAKLHLDFTKITKKKIFREKLKKGKI